MRTFVGKTASILLILLLVYVGTMQCVPPPMSGFIPYQDDPSRRMAIAEHLAFLPPQVDTVVVGSSMTQRLSQRYYSFPPSILNAGITGGETLTYMEILSRAAKKPRLVLVEVNMLGGEPSPFLIERTTGSLWHSIKRLNAFREDWKPMNILLRCLNNVRKTRSGNAPPPNDMPSPENFKVALDYTIKHYNTILTTNKVLNVLTQLKPLVERLEADGVKVCFFATPVHPDIGSILERQVVQHARAMFPPAKYDWFVVDHAAEWHTIDGVHLTQPSCIVFAGQLEAFIARFASNGSTNHAQM